MQTALLRKGRGGTLALGTIVAAIALVFSSVAPSYASTAPDEAAPDREPITFQEATEQGTLTAEDAAQFELVSSATKIGDESVTSR